MCGIAGFFTPRPMREPVQVLRRMSDTIAHRGPDAEGHWLEANHGVGFAHRRLAIVDLTDEGRQPMHSRAGRYTIIFNGEIYNFQRIRAQLETLGHSFRGHSDTEVMLAAFEQWGVQQSLRNFVGMFAFALWDAQQHELILARDRLGKKPIYYSLKDGTLIFGSELKALRAFPGFDASIDRAALVLYLRHLYIPTPYTVYEGTSKLEAAHFARFALRGAAITQIDHQCYWAADALQHEAAAHPSTDSVAAVTSQLESLLRDAVQLRMIADVPLGAFLSGGIDSSLIVALMQSLSTRTVRTFTIGFDEQHYNEAPYAKAVAQHLGTDHTEIYLTPKDTLAVIPKLPQIYDEPFADSSQIPTALVCQMARQHVTVALSGDGGDEGFGGYSRYVQALRVWARLSHVPMWMRRPVSWTIPRIPVQAWHALSAAMRSVTLGRCSADGFGYRMQRMADRLGSSTPQELYRHLMSYWLSPAWLVRGGREPGPSVLGDAPTQPDAARFVEQMMLLDILTYLPDDILVKVDRASMAVALEVRAPLLDHRVLEFAWHMPLSLKLHNGQGKMILRRILSRYVPEELFNRPKAGFGVPIQRWLKGPLREWVEELLDERRLRQEGNFDPAPIADVWRCLRDSSSEWDYGAERLWPILMFQAWLDNTRQTNVAATCEHGNLPSPQPLASALG